MMLGQKMQYMWIYVYVKIFQTRISAVKNGIMRMMSVMGSWGGGGRKALAYLAYTGQVCAAEHKVLRIKQGVEFYY